MFNFRIIFELPASGGVVTSFSIKPLKLIRYVSIMDYVVLVCEGIFCFFLFYYTIEEIIEVIFKAYILESLN